MFYAPPSTAFFFFFFFFPSFFCSFPPPLSFSSVTDLVAATVRSGELPPRLDLGAALPDRAGGPGLQDLGAEVALLGELGGLVGAGVEDLTTCIRDHAANAMQRHRSALTQHGTMP